MSALEDNSYYAERSISFITPPKISLTKIIPAAISKDLSYPENNHHRPVNVCISKRKPDFLNNKSGSCLIFVPVANKQSFKSFFLILYLWLLKYDPLFFSAKKFILIGSKLVQTTSYDFNAIIANKVYRVRSLWFHQLDLLSKYYFYLY